MKSQKNRKWLFLLLTVLALFPAAGWASQAAAQGSTALNLPLVYRARPAGNPRTIFGGELLKANIEEASPKAAAAGLTWTRYNRFQWSAVEKSYPGQRDWNLQAEADVKLAAMSQAGLTPIMIIHSTPEWAQATDSFCGPIKPEHLADFGNFMHDLVERYSKPPYNVKYYEIYNEPDVDPTLVERYSIFGCWGDKTDTTYYGGDYFGQMLNAVYPRIKEADPAAQVLIGGLLLECDYNRTYPDGRDCTPSKFLKGILSTGANSFDMVSYHGYPLRSSNRFDWEREYPLWNHRGGVVLGKLDFIKEQFAQMNVPMKPVILTEAGLLCYQSGACNQVADALQQDQANYAVRLYARATSVGLQGALWYTFDGPGWRDSGILDANQNPRPAYRTFQFLSGRLPGAVLVSSTLDGDLEGYTFVRDNKVLQMWWTNRDVTAQVGFPAGGRLYDKFGQELPAPSNGALQVGFEPLIIESTQ